MTLMSAVFPTLVGYSLVGYLHKITLIILFHVCSRLIASGKNSSQQGGRGILLGHVILQRESRMR